jgi:glycosyltransferase involved in cell wall biosynthesis
MTDATAPSPKHIVIDARIRRSTTGRYTDRLVTHLQDIDHHNRYTILVEPEDTWVMHNPRFTTLPVPYVQFSFSPLEQLRFARLLYSLKPDLVHFTMTQQPLLYFGTIVTTTHDLTMFRFVRRGTTPLPAYKLKIGLYKFLVWFSHRKSKQIIAPTNFVAKDIAAWQPGVAKRLVVTYESSEPPLDGPAEQPAGIKAPFLLYVGTAFPHKNLYKMVEAFELLEAEHPTLKLVITGKRTEKHHAELIEWVSQRGSRERIIFPGFVSDAELKWLYQNTAAYVFTSLSEGFGLPPLEAMAHGAPVVSSDASCMPEVYGEAAHYCDATDPQDIAAKIGHVLDDPTLRQRLIHSGHKRLARYSWQKMAEETLAIYRATL